MVPNYMLLFQKVLYKLTLCQTRLIILSGWFLIITPTYIIGADSVPVPSGVGGEIFCRVIYSQYVVFYLGIVSVHNVALLALERWFAVAKPTIYKTSFTKRRVYLSIVFIWLWSILLNLPHPMEIRAITNESGQNQCQWFTLITSKTARKAIAFLEFIFKFILPLTISMAIFFSLRYYAKHSKVLSQANQGKTGRRLLRMTMATALAVAVCWLPNQLYYLLFKFAVTQLDTPSHHFTVVLCMLNSTVNPWIYCLTNKNYRRKFAKLLLPWRKPGDESTQSESQGWSRSSRYKSEKMRVDKNACQLTESTGIEMSSSNRDSALSNDEGEPGDFASSKNDNRSRVAHWLNYVRNKSRQWKIVLPWRRSANITTNEEPARRKKSDSVTVQNPGFDMSPDHSNDSHSLQGDQNENIRERPLGPPDHTM